MDPRVFLQSQATASILFLAESAWTIMEEQKTEQLAKNEISLLDYDFGEFSTEKAAVADLDFYNDFDDVFDEIDLVG
jgi:hypothetical protein